MPTTSAKAPVSAAKTERLLNLVMCLLYTRHPLGKQQIRRAVAAYGEAPNDEAFDRMFERDKDELRDLGIPLVTVNADPLFETEEGYRIDRREYALPEIAFEPDELAVLGLASRTWAQASLAGPATAALRKLEAAGVPRDDSSLLGFEPRVRTSEPAFDRIKDAVLTRRPVRFTYRKAHEQVGTERTVQPWGLASWHGRWYVTGFDVDRGDQRVFRLGRIDGPVAWAGRAGSYEVPADHDPVAAVSATSSAPAAVDATVRVRTGYGTSLRRRARSVEPGDGGEVLTLVGVDVERLADEIASYGADAVALTPPELVTAVTTRLRGALQEQTR